MSIETSISLISLVVCGTASLVFLASNNWKLFIVCLCISFISTIIFFQYNDFDFKIEQGKIKLKTYLESNEKVLIRNMDCKDLKQHIINEDLNYTTLQYQKDAYIWRCGNP